MKIGYYISLALILIGIFIIIGVMILFYAKPPLNSLGLIVGILTFIIGFAVFVFMAWRDDEASRLKI